MILFHGSTIAVERPEIRLSDRTLDYGNGFYTTTSVEQAEAWTRRRLNDSHKIGYISKYTFNEETAKSLRFKIFTSANEEWLDFVLLNRTVKNFTHDYDIVCGPVANDRVYAAFALYEGGLLNKQQLIAELKTYNLVDQYLFHTERSLIALSFIGASEVKQ